MSRVPAPRQPPGRARCRSPVRRPVPLSGQGKDKERMKEGKEKDARYTNGHLFTTISVSGMTMCFACNKSITAKEALVCPTCNVTIHNRCKDTLPNCTKVKQKQQKAALLLPFPSLPFPSLPNKNAIRERPNSAIYPSESFRQTLLGPRRGRPSLSLSKSVSTTNISGTFNDDSPLGIRRILSQSTDSLNVRNRTLSVESLIDEGPDVILSQLLSDLEADGKEFEADSWSLAVDNSFLQQHRMDVMKRQDVIYGLCPCPRGALPVPGLRKAYAEFCSKHTKALKEYKDLLARDKRFQQFIRRVTRSPLLRRHGVPECILLVTQRITKYPVLIERILKNSKDNEGDCADLSRALRLVKELLSAVDEEVHAWELRGRLWDVFRRVDPRAKVPLLWDSRPGAFGRDELLRRKLVHSGGMLWKTAAGRFKERMEQHDRQIAALLEDKVGIFADMLALGSGCSEPPQAPRGTPFPGEPGRAPRGDVLLHDAIREVECLKEIFTGCTRDRDQNHNNRPEAESCPSPSASNGDSGSINGSLEFRVDPEAGQRDGNGNQVPPRGSQELSHGSLPPAGLPYHAPAVPTGDELGFLVTEPERLREGEDTLDVLLEGEGGLGSRHSPPASPRDFLRMQDIPEEVENSQELKEGDGDS
uniref:rho guanine nucleotide exchange factor 2 n=1 Tax=Lonchura striata TaxID=40157 RepID=UPI0012931E67|nr:rho guanine nucleotide exchange factor 2 [Lonchura striata domestica]